MEQDFLLDEHIDGVKSSKPDALPLILRKAPKDRPFLIVKDETFISTAVEAIFEQWSLTLPDVIISFVSGTQPYTSWKNEDHRAALQNGITKLVNATETWILDSGLDYGLSKAMGDAMRIEQQFRNSKQQQETFVKGYFQRRPHNIVLMGIVSTALVLDEQKKPADGKFELNPSHTHFVLIEEEVVSAVQVRVTIEQKLSKQAGIRKMTKLMDEKQLHDASIIHEQVPLIVVFLQGGVVEIDQVFSYLKNRVPVLIIKGTGFMADVLAYAFEEYKERDGVQKDLESLKPMISKQLARFFPSTATSVRDDAAKRDKILDCLRLAHEGDKWLLSTVQSSDDLVDLDDHVLSAIFAMRSGCTDSSKEQIRSDFLLTMKLNKPDIVSRVLRRDEEQLFQTDNDLFEKALLWKGRERFIERFMEEDFMIHKFLNHSQLLRLFRRAEDNEFFTSVVWEQIPRHYFDSAIDESFVVRDLNLIVEKLSGISNFMSMHELSSNFLGVYVQQEQVAERKAMNALIVWAVLMNRFELVKTLWKFCDDPIIIALFVSSLYRGLERHCVDSAVINVLNANSKAFSVMAIDVLDMSYKEFSARTFDLLNQKFPDFNNKTTVKIAYLSENKYFLAHEACQIWLNKLWSGGIEIAAQWDSRIPEEIKLVLSAFLLFPILFWIRYPKRNFTPSLRKTRPVSADSDELLPPEIPIFHRHAEKDDRFHIESMRDKPTDDTIRKLKELASFETAPKRTSFQHYSSKKALLGSTSSNLYFHQELPFWRQVYYLWAAPRTKFWVSQVFYWIYLGIFSVATILPSCSTANLDSVVLIWTLFNLIETILRTNYQIRHDFPVSIFRRFLEVAFIGGFVTAMTVHKVYFGIVRPIYFREFMAVGLLYMYYRMVAVFFPMNQLLGPMLYRIKRMLTFDFLTFVKLALPFILANMFALQAIMYPDIPFGKETFRKGFYRAFFTLFLAFIGEIDYTQKCEETRLHNVTDVCWTGDYANYMCPTLGWATYILNIQYWIIMRLILVVLLNALFAATMIKVKEDADYIFKYQRYRTVLDFALRPALPPPLSVFNYIFNWAVFCCAKLKRIDESRRKLLTNPRTMKLITRKPAQPQYLVSYSYWMAVTKEYYRKKLREDRDKKIGKDQLAKIKTLSEGQKNMQNTLDRLGDRMRDLEKISLVYFEALKHGMDRKGLAKEGTLQTFSRQSPYPETQVFRFPIADYQIPWNVTLESYDPPSFSKPTSEFPVQEQQFVDPVFTELPAMAATDNQELTRWNSTYQTGNGQVIDRRSWMVNPNRLSGSVSYKMMLSGLPQNPVGRTGLSGRGSLHRYGPNHTIQVVLTCNMDDCLKYLTSKNYRKDSVTLFPKMSLFGTDNIFNATCEMVQSLFVSVETDGPLCPDNVVGLRETIEDMFYPGLDSGRLTEIQEVYCGYLDDPRNTDNAWLEILVWHIHLKRNISQRCSEMFVWKEQREFFKPQPFDQHIVDHVKIQKAVDD